MVVFSDATFNVRRFEFNLTGAMVWELCDGSLTVEEIVGRVMQEFPDTPPGNVRETVSAFLDRIESEWLVRTQKQIDQYA